MAYLCIITLFTLVGNLAAAAPPPHQLAASPSPSPAIQLPSPLPPVPIAPTPAPSPSMPIGEAVGIGVGSAAAVATAVGGGIAGNTAVASAMNSAKAVDQATDAAIYIWAATKRCGNPKDEKVKCAMDITASATAVGNVANIIVAALDESGLINAGKGCGLLAGEITTAIAALAGDSAGMIDACKPNKFEGHSADNLAAIKLNSDTSLGKCIIDAKDSLASIFDAVTSLKNFQKGDTEHNALNTVSALASLGQAVAGAVNDCSAFGGKGNQNAACASRTLGAVSELHRIADLAETMAATCKASASRLYLENDKNTGAITKNSMSLTLAAFLPVAAVLGFVFGRRFGKARANRDFELLSSRIEI